MNPETANEAINQYYRLWGRYETIFLVGTDGISIVTSDDKPLDVSDRAYFKEALSGRISISEPIVSRATGNIVIVFASLFNGFFIGPANIPLVYRWVADISFPSFGVRAATATELAGLTYACTPEEAAAGCTGVGDDVLASLGWGAVDAWQACGWLALETAVFRVLAFLALHFMYTGQPLRERARQLWHG
jgi:hypothetical protein